MTESKEIEVLREQIIELIPRTKTGDHHIVDEWRGELNKTKTLRFSLEELRQLKKIYQSAREAWDVKQAEIRERISEARRA